RPAIMKSMGAGGFFSDSIFLKISKIDMMLVPFPVVVLLYLIKREKSNSTPLLDKIGNPC
ncbi:MAG: hypothetical protein J1E06_01875, partial [Acutalibacter sp.]|nr:hypothetical protein [Acutalibacter sp.]